MVIDLKDRFFVAAGLNHILAEVLQTASCYGPRWPMVLHASSQSSSEMPPTCIYGVDILLLANILLGSM